VVDSEGFTFASRIISEGNTAQATTTNATPAPLVTDGITTYAAWTHAQRGVVLRILNLDTDRDGLTNAAAGDKNRTKNPDLKKGGLSQIFR